jgi:hypothetical protein
LQAIDFAGFFCYSPSTNFPMENRPNQHRPTPDQVRHDEPGQQQPGNNKDKGYRRAGRRTRKRILGQRQRDERRFFELERREEEFEEAQQETTDQSQRSGVDWRKFLQGAVATGGLLAAFGKNAFAGETRIDTGATTRSTPNSHSAPTESPRGQEETTAQKMERLKRELDQSNEEARRLLELHRGKKSEPTPTQK